MLNYIYTGQYEIELPDIFHAALSSQKETEVPEVLSKVESTQNDILRKTMELKAHATVYCCADKYGIAVLKDLAQARFIEEADRAKIYLDFDLLTFVFENTRREDLGLRAYAIKACIEKHDELKGNQKLVSLLIKHEPLIWEVGSGLQARQLAKEAAVKEVETQLRTKEQDILQLSARCDLLEASIVEQKAKAAEDLKTVKMKSSIMLAKVLEDTRAAKADTASEIVYANKLLDFMKNARFCEHCGKQDQLKDPVRKWNEELDKEQYFLQCKSCGWWWFFQDKQPKPVIPKE